MLNSACRIEAITSEKSASSRPVPTPSLAATSTWTWGRTRWSRCLCSHQLGCWQKLLDRRYTEQVALHRMVRRARALRHQLGRPASVQPSLLAARSRRCLHPSRRTWRYHRSDRGSRAVREAACVAQGDTALHCEALQQHDVVSSKAPSKVPINHLRSRAHMTGGEARPKSAEIKSHAV